MATTRRPARESGAAVRDVDDGTRAEHGLCVCLVDEGNGKVRLVLDDVARDGSTWTPRTFFTHNRYSKKAVLAHSLTDKELSKIGLAVMTRLVAATLPSDRPTGKRRR